MGVGLAQGAPRTAAVPRPLARVALAVAYGAACHVLFAAAVVAMFVAMRAGMTLGLGRVGRPGGPASVVANVALLLQFPVGHSLLLRPRGRAVLRRLAPAPAARTLETTTYAIVASLQTLALFLLWTPSGIVWGRASGGLAAAIAVGNAAAWALLGKAIADAGASLQTGLLGWSALARGAPVRFPDLPERGLFRACRQPIYVAFALTTWTVPTWTPDQAAVACGLTAYCLVGPAFKEARWLRLHGERFARYRARVPYWSPWPRPR